MFMHQHFAALALSLCALGAGAQSVNAPEAAQLCMNCHTQSAEQQRTLDAQVVPLLGGQQAEYLLSALKGYSSRQRDHFFMRGIAAGLDQTQLNEIVAYFSAPLPGRSQQRAAAPQPDMPQAAARCVACHGDDIEKPASREIPMLAGQHHVYLTRAFGAYASGGRRHPVMQPQAINSEGQPSLTDDELASVARWFSALPNGVSSR